MGLAAHLRKHQTTYTIPNNKYNHYITQEPTSDQNPLQWWLLPTQQTKYPNLSCMAIDILTIPAMSDEPERVFSNAKLTLHELRSRLGMETLRAFECIKSWNKLKDFNCTSVFNDFTMTEGSIVKGNGEDSKALEGNSTIE